MFLSSKSKTQTTTMYMNDIRQVVQWIIKEVSEIKKYYQNTSLFDDVRLSRDIALMFLEDWIVSVEVELYEPAARRKVYAYSYRATVDPDASHHEPGTFKKFRQGHALLPPCSLPPPRRALTVPARRKTPRGPACPWRARSSPLHS
jgi:hypothetical protein